MLQQTSVGGGHTPAHNRRHCERYLVDLRVRAQVRGGDISRTVHGQVSDLSASGMAIYLAADLAIGETVELELTLPYATSALRVLTIVRSRRSYQYGVEYVNLSASAAAAIRRACTSLALVQ